MNRSGWPFSVWREEGGGTGQGQHLGYCLGLLSGLTLEGSDRKCLTARWEIPESLDFLLLFLKQTRDTRVGIPPVRAVWNRSLAC